MENSFINIRADFTLDLKNTFKDIFNKKDLYFTTVSEENASQTEEYIEHLIILSADTFYVLSIDVLNIHIYGFFQGKISNILYPCILHSVSLNNFIYLFAHSTEQNKFSLHIIDLIKEEIAEVSFLDNNFPLSTGYSMTFSGIRMLFTGGTSLENKLNKDIFFLDLSTYEFGKEKVRNNNLTPRYCHGSIFVEGNLYVIGGFVGLAKEQRFGSGDIKMMRYEDRELTQWENVEVKGNRADYLIEPSVQCFDGKYLIMMANLTHCAVLSS